jgi:hypothetical protein
MILNPTDFYKCPACGTGRWHAQGCSEGLPDKMFDEADRQPFVAVITAALLAQSDGKIVKSSAQNDGSSDA